MKIKRRLSLFLTFLAITVMVYILFQTDKKSFIYTDFGVQLPDEYSLFGIDVSHHQEEINYQEVSEMRINGDSIGFVYIKATEGEDFTDSRLSENALGFSELIPYGFYHFYNPKTSARKQALFFSNTIKGYDYDLIPVLDIEEAGDLSKKQVVDSVQVFLTKVMELGLRRPMVYTYASFYTDYFSETLSEELFWVASYTDQNDLMEKDDVVIWQFSDQGTVNGIRKNTDLNVTKENGSVPKVGDEFNWKKLSL